MSKTARLRSAAKSSARIALFPGTFDPPTNGHMDIIQRGRALFDKLIVAVGHNPEKESLFPTNERLAMLRTLTKRWTNVSIESYDGLTMDFARAQNASAILRGIRDGLDLHYEMQQANVNRTVGDVDTIFLLATDIHILTSSTLIKQIVQLGGNDAERIERLVPPTVAARLAKRLGMKLTKPRAKRRKSSK
jgi:pantetheine-phosphate adenylyltransferase